LLNLRMPKKLLKKPVLLPKRYVVLWKRLKLMPKKPLPLTLELFLDLLKLPPLERELMLNSKLPLRRESRLMLKRELLKKITTKLMRNTWKLRKLFSLLRLLSRKLLRLESSLRLKPRRDLMSKRSNSRSGLLPTLNSERSLWLPLSKLEKLLKKLMIRLPMLERRESRRPNLRKKEPSNSRLNSLKLPLRLNKKLKRLKKTPDLDFPRETRPLS